MKNLVVFCLSALIIFGMISIKDHETAENRYAITVEKPVERTIVESVTLYGTVQEEGRRQIYANGNAEILDVYVKVGDIVSEGDPLVSLRALGSRQESDIAFQDASEWMDQLYQDSLTDITRLQEELQAVFNRVMISSENPSTAATGEEIYTLYSPIDGMVLNIAGQIGSGVTKFFPTVTVTDLDRLSIRATATESNLKNISLDDTCIVTVSALSEYAYHGTIRYISPYAHETDLLSGGGTYVTEVIAAVNNGSAVLRPGYQATVKVKTGEEEALLVHYDSVGQDDTGQEYVMVWTGTCAYRQNVITGKEVDEYIQVLHGLSINHTIIRDVNENNFTERTVLYEDS